MFTVKIVGHDREELIEAQHIQKTRNGIVLHAVQGDGLCPRFFGCGGQEYDIESAYDEQNVGKQLGSATAYAMNRYGSTVATYNL